MFKRLPKFLFLLTLVGLVLVGLSYKDELRRVYRAVLKRVRVDESYKREAISQFAIHGIDVSSYQDGVDWKALEHPDSTKTIDFVFIRATAGLKKDVQFVRNWTGSRANNITRGAYHYYHSDKNSAVQAGVFTSTVKLQTGDLPPVLDIEELPKKQSQENWRKGLKNYLEILKTHYGVQPILYTGNAFYNDYLATDPFFESYDRLWIANYGSVSEPYSPWNFWQYTDALPVKGINEPVDGNVFNENRASFETLLVK